MISYVDNGNAYEFRGLEADRTAMSTTDLPNGCIFVQMPATASSGDTKVFIFDKTNSTWKEM